MSKTSRERWIRLRPPVSPKKRSASVFVDCASAFVKVQRRSLDDEARGRAVTEALDATRANIERAAIEDRAILDAATPRAL